jgi:hypothetical protein
VPFDVSDQTRWYADLGIMMLTVMNSWTSRVEATGGRCHNASATGAGISGHKKWGVI